MATFIPPETRVVLENGKTIKTAWGDFVHDNANSGLDLVDIEVTLAAGETFYGGGGAEPEWSIRRADDAGDAA